MRRARTIIILGILCLPAGCVTTPDNPSFPLTVGQARQELRSMASDRKVFARPVVLLGGFFDMAYSTTLLERELRRVVRNGQFRAVVFVDCQTFDECREKLMREVTKHFPSRDPGVTAEVDVVAASMGGLVARYAAQPGFVPRLRIARLFTIATPHRGAMLADLPTLSELAMQMRSGSDFLRLINSPQQARSGEIIPYVWSNDNIVGAGNAAPPGRQPWWLPPMALTAPHVGAFSDPRIIADIARRLRGERTYTVGPPTPLPVGATATGPWLQTRTGKFPD